MKKKKDRRMMYLAGGFAIVLIAIFALSLLRGEDTSKRYTYNGVLFSKEGNFWYSSKQILTTEGPKLLSLETRFSPRDLEYIPMDRQVTAFFHEDNQTLIDAVYLTMDPIGKNNTMKVLAGIHINQIRTLGITVEIACTENVTDSCRERPIITCEDKFPVIYLKESDREQITYVPHRCVVIEGKDIGMVKSVERLLFQWYGVMY